MTYLKPSYIWHHAKSRIRSWEDVKYTFEGVTALFGHLKDFSRKPEARGSGEILSAEQVARMDANMHNPRQELVAIKVGSDGPIPHKKVEEVGLRVVG